MKPAEMTTVELLRDAADNRSRFTSGHAAALRERADRLEALLATVTAVYDMGRYPVSSDVVRNALTRINAPAATPKEPPVPKAFAPYPKDKPPRYNGSSQPCDMWRGPCSCGAWHHGEDDVTERPATPKEPR